MELICPIDQRCSSQITALLQPPSPPFVQLITKRRCQGIKVKQNDEFGKGVFPETEFEEEQLILKDQLLVGAQHPSNKIDCLVCSYCFKFIGSIEQQIGRKLYLKTLGIGISSHTGCQSSSSDEDEDDNFVRSHYSFENGASSSSGTAIPLPTTAIYSLMNETNDIFLLVAKAISFTILRYRNLKASHLREQENNAYGFLGTGLSLLLEAWKPISIGHKRRWWDCISLPDDVDGSDEVTFRRQIRDLAFPSLQLLKEAIFDKECEPLFYLEIYGHIIGMFELNNFDLVVASPVEDYFLYINDLPYPEKKEAEKITQQYLDALGDDYSICCQGTAFFPLQSCMNHSCCPNAKAFKREEDRDGQATIIALGPIYKGEEVRRPFIRREASIACGLWF